MNRKSLKRSASLALFALTLAGASSAQAFSGTPEQRRACHDDAMRFCSQFVPLVPAIQSCMERNLNRLSRACRAQFR